MKFWKKVGSIFVSIMASGILLSNPSTAACTLTFGNITGPSGATLTPSSLVIEAYWSALPSIKPEFGNPPAMQIADGVTSFNTNPANSVSDTPTSSPTKFFGYKTSSGYYFWRYPDDTAPGGTIYIRFWDSTKTYYLTASFSNGAKADSSPPAFTISQGNWYKATPPDKPSITNFEESSLTPPGGTAKSSLKVYSSAGAVTDGNRVITGYSWAVTDSKNKPVDLSKISSASSNLLQLPDGTLNKGESYTYAVTYKNWFTPDAVSDSKSYTLSAGGAAGVVQQSSTFSFLKGLNFFSLGIPAAANGNWYVGTTPVKTVQELITQIEAVNPPQAKVSTFGYVDNSGAVVGVKKKADGTFDNQSFLSNALSAIQGYQVYLTNGPVPLKVQNY